jgi:hypothetical protein
VHDPFGTAALRAAVLDAWAASPTRFREDANAEEDLRLGGYADTWFVELAQNAADAADSGGKLRVTAADREVRVANTGAALTTEGVAALASLRASAKRDDVGSVGRFGVGFSAVLAVSDAPRVVSASGAVTFSAGRTAEAVADLPGPSAELARRDAPPTLRLVWPTDEQPPEGFTTEVRLPLRAGLDAETLLAHARAVAPDLLLTLPALDEIDVAGHVVRRTEADGVVTVGERQWRIVRRTGVHGVVDGAAEQRDRREWAVTWALPLDGKLGDDVAHAPTATAEALALPARLIATLPLEPDRRRVRPGPAADAVLDGAAAAYVDLVRSVNPGERLALVPEPGFPRSPLDGRLRARLIDALRAATWLPAAAAPAELAPGRAEWLDIPGTGPRLPALLAAAGFDGLAAPPYLPAALTELGARRVTAAELVERLFGVEQPPSWWRALYGELAELADTVPGLVDDLRALPVPLVDGRAAAGPATVLLPELSATAAPPSAEALAGGPADGSAALAGLALPGLHLAHPDAVHPLLARLGATPADPAILLDHPALRAAVERSVEDAEAGLDSAPLAEAVLALVAAAGAAPEALAALALPDADGRPARADELMLPDAVLRPLLADDAPLDVLDPDWAARFPREVLTAVGVLDGFAVVVDEEPVGPDHELDDEDRWWDGLDEPPVRLVAVRDLDLVDDDAWQGALALLAADRAAREAAMNGYTAWWLAKHARFDGRRPHHWRLPSAAAIAALYDPVPLTGSDATAGSASRPRPDDALLAAIGVRRDLQIVDARSADDLLARLADPDRHPSAALVAAAHIALAEAVAENRVDAADLDLPEYVRAMDGSVVHVDDAAVLDAPWPAAVLPAAELVIGGDPVALAELLDLPLASEIVAGEVEGEGEPVAWAELGEIVVTCHTLGVDVPDGGLRRHPELWVNLRRPVAGRHRVPVWRDPSGIWHAEDPLRALLALLAG